VLLYFIDEALEQLLELVVDAGNRGVLATRNVTGEPNWSFGQSLFFSGTVATTIGEFVIYIFVFLKKKNALNVYSMKTKNIVLFKHFCKSQMQMLPVYFI
jgi:hypothetical protein